MSREKDKDEEEGTNQDARKENPKSPVSAPEEIGLTFGIERILYGSTKKG